MGLNGFLNFIPLPPPGGVAGRVHGRPLCLALRRGDPRVSDNRRFIAAGQSIRAIGAGNIGAGNRQHPDIPCINGPERPADGPTRGDIVDRNLHRGATSLFGAVPVALAAAGLSAEEGNQNMSQNKLTVVVTGATGKQGGAVAQGLLARGHKVRAVTRDPNSKPAKLLADAGASLVTASLDDNTAIAKALEGATSLFAMTTPFGGTEAEIGQGVAAADAAKAAGVHLVFTSVGSANKQTGVPHFDSKYKVEKHITKVGVRSTILAPVAFMENIHFVKEQLAKGVYASALSPTKTLAQIAVPDIGAVAVRVLEEPARFTGKRFDLAGDELSGNEAMSTLSRVIGRPFSYFHVPLDVVRQRMGEDAVTMYEWFERVGFAVDRATLRREFPDVTFRDFESWAKTQDWSDLHV
jgi:uncharacterized protein YbjT (DUF2867 family)